MLLGLYVVIHGHLTPGGGFQGGVALAAAPIMIYLAGRYLAFRAVNPMTALDFGEGAGAGGFVIIGLVGMIVGSAYLLNFLPIGESGDVFSGGTLPLINLSVGLEVAAESPPRGTPRPPRSTRSSSVGSSLAAAAF